MPIDQYFDTPFGASGELATIPDAVQVDGSVSYASGWGIDYTLINTNPSYKSIPWGQFNQLFFDITTAIQNWQQNTIAPFITTSMNGGTPYSYPQYAMVLSGGIAYQSNTGSNTDTPPSSKWNVASFGALSSSAPTQSSVKNLASAWASNTTATMTADEIVLQNSTGNAQRISAFNKTVNSAASGAGGLDTGSIATNTWYYIYAIFNPTTSTQSILMSTSATAPTLPSGYTFASGPLSVVRTDGSSNFIGFIQKGNRWQYTVGNNLAGMPLIASGLVGSPSAGTYVSIAMATFCPVTSIEEVSISVYTSAASSIIISPNASYGADGSTSNPPFCDFRTSGSGGINVKMLLESSNIYWASDDSGSHLYINGFTINI